MNRKQELMGWFAITPSITQMQAIKAFGNTRLADTIFQLRAKGHVIETELLEKRGADNVTRYARYHYKLMPNGQPINKPGFLAKFPRLW